MKTTLAAIGASLFVATTTLAQAQPGRAAGAAQRVPPPAVPVARPATAAQFPANDARYQIVDGQVLSDDDAERTREKLRTILRQYPPSLADVLRLDTTLLTNESYLAPYPELAAFLKQHPNVIHNASYFVGAYRSEWNPQPRSALGNVVRSAEQVVLYITFLTGILGFMTLIGWTLKRLIDHRRWLRMSKLQADAHAKVFDRLSSNEDLLAYIQSPAGQRYLQSAPLVTESARSLDAPVGRILFTSQVGTVVTFVGIALAYLTRTLANNSTPDVSELAPFMLTASVMAIAIGLGFLASAGVAYALSRRLGLLESPAASPHA
jgi:hypothetical protein